MTDLQFEVFLQWKGTGQEGEGKLTAGDDSFIYSSPANMGGKGVGMSPEDLLISAVSSCYSGTLFALLEKKGLPVENVSVRAEGHVNDYPLRSHFAQITVHPHIIGGDLDKEIDYIEAASSARDKCFIGKTIQGNVAYEVGDVSIVKVVLKQEKIDELVDTFYTKLTKDAYYRKMFEERGVDLDLLKERQRRFISRLINPSPFKEKQNETEVVKKRHSFSTTPERAETWLRLMEEAMTDIQLTEEVRTTLLDKMSELMKTMIKN